MSSGPTPKTMQLLGLVAAWWPALLTISVFGYLLHNRYHSGLSEVPGPVSRTLTPLPRIWSVFKGFSHDDDIALHRRYGSLVRVAPNVVSVNDPAEVNNIYGIGTKLYKGAFYSLVEVYDEEGVVPDPFVITDRALHIRLKKGAASAYSLNTLVQMEPYLDAVSDRLTQKLDAASATGQVVEFSALLREYAMDAISALKFGKDFDHMSGGDVLGFFRATTMINDYMAIFGQIPWCHNFLLGNPWIARWFDSTEGNARMIALAKDEIDADRKGLQTSGDAHGPMTFMQKLLAQQKQNPASLSDRELITHCFNNIAAGSDTTAIALRSILFHTLRDATVRGRLATEVREAFPHGDTASCTFAAANKLPFLGAVIKEGIRIHPSVGMILVRVIPKGGAMVCGRYLPAGVEVGINPWVLHRDPTVYKDPDAFRPERWLVNDVDAEHLRRMNRSWVPFGHGAHTCSGRWISWMEIHKIIATLFLKFDMELADGGRGYTFHNLWFTPQTGLHVRFHPVQLGQISR